MNEPGYQFPALLIKHGLSLTKEKVMEGGEIVTVDVPKVTVTLTFTGSKAKDINAKLSAYHGNELLVVVENSQRGFA